MKIEIVNPVKAIVVEYTDFELELLKAQLTYTNSAVQHSIKRHYNNFWLKSKNKERWQYTLNELNKELKKTLVFEEDGQQYIRPGSIPYLSLPNLTVENKVVYPALKKVAWEKPLPFSLYPYQEESWTKLLAEKHGNVELCTAAGKTACILKLAREMGLQTVIVTPSASIFNEILEKFEHHFGRNKVGGFGDGKKKIGKLFTVCISKSLSNLKPGTPEHDFFSKTQVFMGDESQTLPAETLEQICHGVLANVPYRFFFSGTQTRNDGTEKLLYGIIGRTVNTLSTKDAVAGKYICEHEVRVIEIESSNPNYNDPDVLQMKRAHFLKNKNICQLTAKLANLEAKASKKQTLILVEEMEQIAMIVPLLTVPFAIAHSEKSAVRLNELGLKKVDPAESVEAFNKAEAMVLIGTSCIATGTNIYPTHNTINWAGGSSEIKTKQGPVGRSVRLGKANPWANKCTPKDKAVIWDFNVYDVSIMAKHLEERVSFYKDGTDEIKFIRLSRK